MQGGKTVLQERDAVDLYRLKLQFLLELEAKYVVPGYVGNLQSCYIRVMYAGRRRLITCSKGLLWP